MRGAVVAGVVITILELLFYSCTLLFSGNSSYGCGIFLLFVIYTPHWIFNAVNSVLGDVLGYDLVLMMTAIVFWSFLGAFVGGIVGYLNTRRKSV